MQPDFTFTQVKNAFQAIAGLESLSSADEFFLTSSLNRAVQRAYDESDSWPRYLVAGEERLLIDDQVVPYASGCNCTDLLANCSEEYNELVEEYNAIVEALEKSCDTRPPGGFWEDRAKIWMLAYTGSCDNYFHFAEAYVSATFSQEVTFLGNSIGYGYALIKNTTQVALYSVKEELQSYPFGPALPPRNPSSLPRSLCNGDLNIQVAKDLGNGQFGNLQDGINSTTGTGRYGVFSRAQFDERAPGGFYYNKPSLPSTIQLGWFTYLGDGQYEYEAMEDDPCGNPIAPTHRVTYNAGTGGTISGIDVQNIPTGEVSQTVSAVADAGYTFTGWSDGSTINPRTDVDVQSTITVTANFVLTP
jgi:uncharacterized repeat protein (TIGR02543 family)